jgi:hypothetical protein
MRTFLSFGEVEIFVFFLLVLGIGTKMKHFILPLKTFAKLKNRKEGTITLNFVLFIPRNV